MTSAFIWGWVVSTTPRQLYHPVKTRYPLYSRLGRPQGRSGRVRKISLLPGIDLWTVQPVASRYTDWANGYGNCIRKDVRYWGLYAVMWFDVYTVLLMPVKVFLKVASHENVDEESLYLTMSVNVPITMTSMLLRNYEHRNQVKKQRTSIPPMKYSAEARIIISYCSTF
jgi:hypothetical protein